MERYFLARDGVDPTFIPFWVSQRLVKKVEEGPRLPGFKEACLLWKGGDSRIRMMGKRVECDRFVYEYCVAPLLPTQRLYKICNGGKNCLQIGHMRAKNCDKASQEWVEDKKARCKRKNDSRKDPKNKKIKTVVEEAPVVMMSADLFAGSIQQLRDRHAEFFTGGLVLGPMPS